MTSILRADEERQPHSRGNSPLKKRCLLKNHEAANLGTYGPFCGRGDFGGDSAILQLRGPESAHKRAISSGSGPF